MKSVINTAVALLLTVLGFAQKDTTKPKEPDTIKVGNFIIIKKDKKANSYDTSKESNANILVDIGSGEGSSHHHYHRFIMSTN